MSKKIVPVETNGLDMAFGGDMKKLLPPMHDIPKEFQDGHTPWNELVSKWFYIGLSKLELTPREGIDKSKALRHVKAVMASWEPKHEHKEAGCAYLMSQFFEETFEYETKVRA